jgi:hypothetical protein
MIKKSLFYLSLLISTSIYAGNSQIHSGTIIKDTLAAMSNCTHYEIPTHFCVWVSEWGEINTTPILNHYLPDLVVSVFTKPHDNPWLEINKIVDSIGEPIQKGLIKGVTGLDVGSGNHSLLNSHEQSVIHNMDYYLQLPPLGNRTSNLCQIACYGVDYHPHHCSKKVKH